ncbi:amino acid ABC transporter permease, partial [Bacillus pumilus]
LLHHAHILNGQSQSYLLPIFPLAAMMYFVVNFSLSLLARRLEYRQA